MGDFGPAWADDEALGRNNLDFVRLALAVVVIISHSYPVSGSGLDPLERITRRHESLGSWAVDGFFLISGFLITRSWLRSRSPLGYLKKRVLRIYPAFIAANVLGAGLFAPLGSQGKLRLLRAPSVLWAAQVSLRLQMCVNSLAFPRNPLRDAVDYSMWTIRYEFTCYLFVMALGLLLVFRSRILTAVVCVGLVAAGYVALGRGASAPQWLQDGVPLVPLNLSAEGWPRLLAYFVAGMLFYLFRDRIPFRRDLAIAAALAVGLSLLRPSLLGLTFPVCGGYLLFAFAFDRRIPLQRFGRYGDFSYGTYLYAFPIQQLLMSRLALSGRPWTLTALAIPLSIFAGVLSWYGMEKWFLTGRRGRKQAPGTASSRHQASPTTEREPTGTSA